MSETTQDQDELSARMDTASQSNIDDMETGSAGGFSDDANASLVGFGEGARTPARHSGIGSPAMQGPKPGSAVPMHLFPAGSAGVAGDGRVSASSSMTTQTTASTAEATRDARMIDGMTYDEGSPFVDTAGRTPPPTTAAAAGLGPAQRSPERVRGDTERILRENLDRGEDGTDRLMMDGGKGGLGKFSFEGKGGQ